MRPHRGKASPQAFVKVPNRAKGVPARFVPVRSATAAEALSEGWRFCLRPNTHARISDSATEQVLTLENFSVRTTFMPFRLR
jgi:hypothetical protein